MDRREFLFATGTGATAAWAGIGQNARESLPGAGMEQASRDDRPMNGLEQSLAQYAASVRFEDLPGEVVQACKRLLLDA